MQCVTIAIATWQCVVLYLSQRKVISHELLWDAIFCTNLHLTENYTFVNGIAVIMLPSTHIQNCIL